MVKSKAEVQRSYVHVHIDQTHLVCELLQKGFLNFGEIEWWHEGEEGEYPEIYQWKMFPRFTSDDYEKLVEAEIPVLSNESETWVGLTDCGSPYDLYVYPRLIRAIFGERADDLYKKTAQQC